tara:strand:- start:221 stop:499 length:279 start_codon:yes stop_codon:yes gene_type:complete
MFHTELAVLCQEDSQAAVIFSTEAGKGKGSKWRTSREENYSFYMSLYKDQWRAVPVFDKDLANKVRQNCHQKVPYSWSRYITSIWGLRSLAW